MFNSTRTGLDEVKKLQLAAEFLDYRDPVRPAHPHQEVEGEGVGDKGGVIETEERLRTFFRSLESGPHFPRSGGAGDILT